ncbi:hypothetical protein JQK15_24810 [Sphingobium sp. BHU LFT2]|uniref:asparagine synthase-related protein n=1 Tax=Sphingobium sp. BHU LFT2 TaxID=2807634 RepID=UPI001BEC554D|nr:asparagine synthase-related protein [Sphingobium sp. BHU LFT2]MBT2246733.1 hypothetical protein [Sphingobium sp. BHU LFT2]
MSQYLILGFAQIDQIEQTLQQIAVNVALREIYRGDHIVLFTDSPEDIVPFPAGRGAIFGTLFSRCRDRAKVIQFEGNQLLEVIENPVRSLRDDYWGAYVAIIDQTKGVTILRDPAGGLPCYYTTIGNMVACASDVSILMRAGLARPSINWRAVGKSLYHLQLPAEETGLSDISQLLGGCGLTIGTRGITKFLFWSPWDYVGTDCHSSSQKCAADLRDVVRSTVQAWASHYARPLVGLSGGLDSSIVAECLVHAGAEVTCVTAITNDPTGDERVYAKAVCDAINAKLIQGAYSEEDIDIEKSTAANLPIPSGKLDTSKNSWRLTA